MIILILGIIFIITGILTCISAGTSFSDGDAGIGLVMLLFGFGQLWAGFYLTIQTLSLVSFVSG